MAYHCKPKFLSTSEDTYRHPVRDQYDFKHYNPQQHFPSKNAYSPDKGTERWFQDYRRTNIEENALQKNLTTLQSPVRPSRYSDKPDIALGARKQNRESLFPVIQNNPVYVLTNRNSDQIRDRDIGFMSKVYLHRDQMRDRTGYFHKKEDNFYFPFAASETFKKRNVSTNCITDFPSHSTSANEFIFDTKRTPALVDHNKTNIYR